uniref:Uncharacterized protein n=1 Tax=Lactuca sativa TaxID=4236 RepID=A0A9R1WLQ0_LACSA|nr:hypothetical protein LSAT_V11C100039190 [Lactuca sativa]
MNSNRYTRVLHTSPSDSTEVAIQCASNAPRLCVSHPNFSLVAFAAADSCPFDYAGGKHPAASSSFIGYRTREKKETDFHCFECGTQLEFIIYEGFRRAFGSGVVAASQVVMAVIWNNDWGGRRPLRPKNYQQDVVNVSTRSHASPPPLRLLQEVALGSRRLPRWPSASSFLFRISSENKWDDGESCGDRKQQQQRVGDMLSGGSSEGWGGGSLVAARWMPPLPSFFWAETVEREM